MTCLVRISNICGSHRLARDGIAAKEQVWRDGAGEAGLWQDRHQGPPPLRRRRHLLPLPSPPPLPQ